MRMVGHSDLQARTAYQPVIQRQGNRWIAYVGHHGDKKLNPLSGRIEDNGTSIIDVTDPKDPKYLAHIPGEEGKAEQGGAQMVRICSGADLPKADKSKFYMLRVFGNQAHEIWDVTEPAKPSLLTTVVTGLKGTHKNYWECDTGIAYLVSGHPQWRTNRMTQIYDLSDPARPGFIRDFGLRRPATRCERSRFPSRCTARSPPDPREPRVLRLRHQHRRRAADCRSREAAGGAEGPDA